MKKETDPNKAASDARADRLNSWVKTHYRNQQEFIDKFGLNQGEIANIIGKKRVIGERKARKLEDQTDIPFMYLDGSTQEYHDDQEWMEKSPSNQIYYEDKNFDSNDRRLRVLEILKKIDKIKADGNVSSIEIMAIDLLLDSTFRTVEDLIKNISNSTSQNETTTQKTG